jgi:Mg2+ and Co2+ transporter CorA
MATLLQRLIGLCVGIVFCGCSTTIYCETIGDKELFTVHYGIPIDKEMIITFNYLEQEAYFAPWADFEMWLGYRKPEENGNIEILSITYDIYKLDNVIIQPIEEKIDAIEGEIYKKYNNTIFFPRKIKAKMNIKLYYNDIYQEYSYEAIIEKKIHIFFDYGAVYVMASRRDYNGRNRMVY